MAVTQFTVSSIKTGEKFRTIKQANDAALAIKVPTGGDEIVTISGTRYHVFTNSGSFVVPASKSVEILVVGGGGGGGVYTAGGGGGGEIDLFAAQTLSAGSYTCTVGALGAGSTDGNNKGANGGQSQFIGASTITALGGGGGGSSGSGAGANGGSGGGGSQAAGGTASGSNTNAGGIGRGGGFSPNYGGGGGGGATAVGGNGTSTAAGAGGAGYALSTIDANLTSANFTSLASMTHLSAGGGGGTVNGGTAGAGGSSGQGGAGSINGNTPGSGVSFGSGGGGGSSLTGSPPYGNGANGKAGVIIIKYAA
jgi:hypothetical protein